MAKKRQPGKVSEKEVLDAQSRWGDAIVNIGHAYTAGKDVVRCASDHIKKLYDYDKGKVLFKPTKCEKRQFRLTFEGALSYFVGNEFVQHGFSEDTGFAIAPYVSVKFMNAEIITEVDRAIAMGNYIFSKSDGQSIKVEYTFGYRRRSGLLIDVHHSSLPFKPEEPAQ